MAYYQPKDRRYHEAKAQNYFSRAAFKLLEIHQKTGLFHPGQWVLDLGCSPGSWSQVACHKIGGNGLVLGIDHKSPPVKNLSALPANFEFLQGDICAQKTQEIIHAWLAQKPSKTRFDLILSDLSPKLTGIKDRDQMMQMEMMQTAFGLAQNLLHEKQSHFIFKYFPGKEADAFIRGQKIHFRLAKTLKLDASRTTSREMYFHGKGLA